MRPSGLVIRALRKTLWMLLVLWGITVVSFVVIVIIMVVSSPAAEGRSTQD